MHCVDSIITSLQGKHLQGWESDAVLKGRPLSGMMSRWLYTVVCEACSHSAVMPAPPGILTFEDFIQEPRQMDQTGRTSFTIPWPMWMPIQMTPVHYTDTRKIDLLKRHI